jgi:hypothetical protein
MAMAVDAWAKAQKRVARIAAKLGLLEISEGTSYGTPALKVRDKSFTRLKDPETLVLLVPIEHKDLLIEMAPSIYFETDHYRGWPAVLVRLAAISDEELGQRLREGWRFKAPRKLLAATNSPAR